MQKKQFQYFIIFVIFFVNFTYSQKRIEGYIKGVYFNVCDDVENKQNINKSEFNEKRYIINQFKFNLDSIIHKRRIRSTVPVRLLELTEAGVNVDEKHVLKLLENNNYFTVIRYKPWIFYGGINFFVSNDIKIGEYVFWASKEQGIFDGVLGFTLGIVYKNQILRISLWTKEEINEICKIFPEYFIVKNNSYLWKDKSDFNFGKFIKDVLSNKEKLTDNIFDFFECCDLLISSIRFEGNN
jgi:hypothetical protein